MRTQVSVQRSRRSILVPSPSMPLPAQAPVAIATCPKAITFTSLIPLCSHLPPLRLASKVSLPETFPSVSVLTKRSARSGATTSGFPAFWASAHLYSRSEMDFSTSGEAWARAVTRGERQEADQEQGSIHGFFLQRYCSPDGGVVQMMHGRMDAFDGSSKLTRIGLGRLPVWKIPSGMARWNPTFAHSTRKDGAPGTGGWPLLTFNRNSLEWDWATAAFENPKRDGTVESHPSAKDALGWGTRFPEVTGAVGRCQGLHPGG